MARHQRPHGPAKVEVIIDLSWNLTHQNLPCGLIVRPGVSLSHYSRTSRGDSSLWRPPDLSLHTMVSVLDRTTQWSQFLIGLLDHMVTRSLSLQTVVSAIDWTTGPYGHQISVTSHNGLSHRLDCWTIRSPDLCHFTQWSQP